MKKKETLGLLSASFTHTYGHLNRPHLFIKWDLKKEMCAATKSELSYIFFFFSNKKKHNIFFLFFLLSMASLMATYA